MNEVKIFCKYDKLVDPSDLLEHPKNRNRHGQDQIERLTKLYSFHGVRHPIIVSNLTGFIVAGHGRRMAAIRAGIKEFPVVYQDFDSSEQEYAFIQSDNAIALWADLDLGMINQDLADLGPEFDIDMIGIKDFKLDLAEAEMPNLSSAEPGFQQVTFVLSNEQKDILDEALEKAKKEEDCSDELNQNKNGNVLTAILKRYVYG